MLSGLEIFFIFSVLFLLILWGWFIVQGFNASRIWGAGMIFLFPISPFMFAYRFERKSRQAIFYFIGGIVEFILLLAYIQFATIDFYPHLLKKMRNAMPTIHNSSKPKLEKKLDLPPPTPIPPPLIQPAEETASTVPVIIKDSSSTQQKSYKQTIDVGSAGSYIGKKVIITTDTSVVHQGRLLAVEGGEIIIRKTLSSGSVQMGIKKSKIVKLEVQQN